MTPVSKGIPKMHESVDDKRRKRPPTDDQTEATKSIVLPQKKRVLTPSSTGSPAKKTQKTSSAGPSPDEGVADENLIRETEAALTNLSGSWPGPRGGSYKRQQEESPAFENLFDEKKAVAKLSPSASSNSSSDNACSLKDVITLREQHEEMEEKGAKGKAVKIKQEVEDGE